MADKMRRTFPIRITAVPREQPAAEKITQISDQSRNGLGLVEYAVGDVWNQAGDAFFGSSSATESERKRLLIPSVGRFLGPTQTISPRLLATGNEIEFIELTPSLGTNAVPLRLKVKSATLPSFSSGPALSSNILDVDATGEKYFDSTTGKVFSWDLLNGATDRFTYSVSSTDFPGHANLRPNIIPPPQVTLNYTGCKVVAKSGDHFYLVLPPRVAPTVDSDASLLGLDLSNGNNDNKKAVTTSPLRYYWEEDAELAIDATNGSHYRHKLPSLLADLGSGERIPDGFIKLSLNGIALDGVVFYTLSGSDPYYSYSSFVIEIDAGLNESVLTPLTYSHDMSSNLITDYSTGIRLITTGSSVGELLGQLVWEMRNHTHGFLTAVSGKHSPINRRVSHQDLVDLDLPYTAVSSPTTYPFGSGTPLDVRLLKSNWNSDGHLSYLHRAGSRTDIWNTASAFRDVYNNAFLGHMIISSTSVGTAPYYNNLSADSHGLFFGSASGPKFNYVSSSDSLVLSNKGLQLGAGVLDFTAPGTNSYRMQSSGGFLYCLRGSSPVVDSAFLRAGSFTAMNTAGTVSSSLALSGLSFTSPGSTVFTFSTGSSNSFKFTVSSSDILTVSLAGAIIAVGLSVTAPATFSNTLTLSSTASRIISSGTGAGYASAAIYVPSGAITANAFYVKAGVSQGFFSYEGNSNLQVDQIVANAALTCNGASSFTENINQTTTKTFTGGTIQGHHFYFNNVSTPVQGDLLVPISVFEGEIAQGYPTGALWTGGSGSSLGGCYVNAGATSVQYVLPIRLPYVFVITDIGGTFARAADADLAYFAVYFGYRAGGDDTLTVPSGCLNGSTLQSLAGGGLSWTHSPWPWPAVSTWGSSGFSSSRQYMIVISTTGSRGGYVNLKSFYVCGFMANGAPLGAF